MQRFIFNRIAKAFGASRVFMVAILGSCILWCAGMGAANAASIPGMDTSVALMARETSVKNFLQQLFGQIGIPVVVDARVTGTVNGDWRSSAVKLHQQTMRSFQLITYYDGLSAYVYNSDDLVQNLLPVNSVTAKKIYTQANYLGLPDANNRLRLAGDGGLVVSGTPRFAEQVKEISVSVRRNTKKYVPQITEKLFYLKHAWAQDTNLEIGGQVVAVPGMVTILKELLATNPIGESAYTPPKPGSVSVPRMDDESGGVNSALIPTNLQQAQSSRDTHKPTAYNKGSDNRSKEEVRIVAVPRLNAIAIRDLETHIASYKTLIDSLDIEPYMLEIEATIIDISTDKSQELGVNWRAQGDNFNEALVGNGTFSDQLLRPDTNITPQGSGGILSLAFGNQTAKFLARIRALEEDGDAEIVSKPHVVTLSNVEAVLDTTESFFVRVAGVEDAALFKITAGTTLKVTPHVYTAGGESRIKLMVNIQDGATSDAQVDSIPVVGQSTITTQAIITAGDSLLVGGMVRESKRNAVSKVPLLGDLPGLGSLFRTRSNSNKKVERLFLITPRLAHKKGFGKRMDAPVLEGTQHDIISTSNSRMQTTLVAMDKPAQQFRAIPVENTAKPMPMPIEQKVPDVIVVNTEQAKLKMLVRDIKSRLVIPPVPGKVQSKEAAVSIQQPIKKKQWHVVDSPNSFDTWNEVDESSTENSSAGVTEQQPLQIDAAEQWQEVTPGGGGVSVE